MAYNSAPNVPSLDEFIGWRKSSTSDDGACVYIADGPTDGWHCETVTTPPVLPSASRGGRGSTWSWGSRTAR